jgi:hypothetical protein
MEVGMPRIAQRKLILLIIILALVASGGLWGIDVVGQIIAPAQSLKGAPYSFGSTGPGSFDCSGLVYYLYKPLIPTIPRTSRDYLHYGTAVSRENLRPGDLLLFATAGNPGRVTHIAVYIGQQSVIHAVSNGPETGVVVSSIDSGYWKRTFHSARRVLSAAEVSPDASSVSVEYERGTYRGPLKEGEPSGRGVMRLNNGDLYEGDFKDGLFHGNGTYTWADGESYSGEFRRGEMLNPPAKAAEEPSYLQRDDSPWDSWDGEVYGDYREWRSQEESAFEAFKARDKAGANQTLP